MTIPDLRKKVLRNFWNASIYFKEYSLLKRALVIHTDIALAQ